MLDKAAFSSGLSRSTNLAVLEEAMEKHISKTRTITENISKGTKLNLRSSDALKSIGRLFLIRGKLNLYSELIETP
ncbi:CMF_HP2_G0012080.mRNA.1.CDS.1 [Saccharomyces cerevisiae]|nr:CMF_HP2_G0012080.mRNA.1.CDS.1 [Saccharomyces cerevisiae]CAI6442802.1 CMF_HP2_G0012080.mRNA.1.CDS.1 [Saccharomyces cerevisiae]